MKRPPIRYWHLFGLLSVLSLPACAATPAISSFEPAASAPDAVQTPVSSPSPEGAAAREPLDTAPAPSAGPQESPSPSPAVPIPTPKLLADRVLISTSPDGLWKAEALLGSPSDPASLVEALGYSMDYARLTVFRVDGSQRWTPYEEWSETGLGDSFLSEIHWSADGRCLYFVHSGAADGCGTPFVTDLRRVDLRDGSLSQVPLTGLGLDVITISPDAARLAYRTAEGFLVYDLERGEARTLPYEWRPGIDYLVGGYAWSPDGKELAFTITEGFCEPLEEAQASTWVIDLESGAVRAPGAQDAWLPPAGGAPPDPLAEAALVLQGFLDRLSGGRTDLSSYEWAADLYGGSYATLVEINPNIDPDDHAALLRSACQVNGYQCLRLREVLATETVVGENGLQEFRFTVTLLAPDGSAFSRGPCCGEAAGAPQTEFIFTVRQMEDGAFKVLDLPPYVP